MAQLITQTVRTIRKRLDSLAPILVALTFTLPSPSAQADGGWISGGGDVVRNSNNPWFLENTKVVRTCIEASPEFLDVQVANLSGTAALRHLIQDALSYWKKEFKFASGPGYPSSGDGSETPRPMFKQIKVATQEFEVSETCFGGEDLVFRFGTLTPEQNSFLIDPRQHIAITVRTGYDESALHGQGFIYVSPDSGERRYRGDHLIESAWHLNDGFRLGITLVHELGHVFGIPHADGFMSQTFPERLLSGGLFRWYLNQIPAGTPLKRIIGNYFARGEELDLLFEQTTANFSEAGFRFLQDQFHDNGYAGFRTLLRQSANGYTLSAEAYKPDGHLITQMELGTLVLNPEPYHFYQRVSGGVVVFLTEAQRVFPERWTRMVWLQGPQRTITEKTGTLHLKQGTETVTVPVQLSWAPNSISMRFANSYGKELIGFHWDPWQW